MQGEITQHHKIASIANSEGSNHLLLLPIINTICSQIPFYICMAHIGLFLCHKKRIGLKHGCKIKCILWMHFRKISVLFEKVS